MNDLRKAIADYIGQIALNSIELAAQNAALKAENETLKRTQSEGQRQADALLADEADGSPAPTA